MLVKMGVSVRRLERPARRALPIIENVYRSFGYEPVITSTDEGNHSPGSLHYAGLAVDIRNPPNNVQEISLRLRVKLGNAYDVVAEHDHVHIEYDPS